MPNICWNGLELEMRVIDSNFKVAIQNEYQKMFDNNEAALFIERIKCSIESVLMVPINYQTEPNFTFFVIQNGEVFQRLTSCPFPGGMCVAPNRSTTLVVDDKYFFSTRSKWDNIGLIHELSHIVHGFFFNKLYPISEGFAEVFPFYILDMEKDDPRHLELLRTLSKAEIITIEQIRQHGMFTENMLKPQRVQYMKSYISMYLFMRGYIQRLEKINNLDKVAAINLLLAEFQKTDVLEDFNLRIEYIARLINTSFDSILYSKEIQMQALVDMELH
jgi:hypothetical protein